MTQIPVQLLMPFETLIETIRSLDIEDQLRLQRLLNQEIDRRTAQSQEQGLQTISVQGGSAEMVRHDPADSRSFLEVAHAFIGAGEGPGDLSTNPSYMQGYGQ